MIPELGQIALVVALLLAIVQGVLPLIGAQRGDAALIAIARPAAYAQFAFAAISYGILTSAFLSNDFSLQYVASNSNSALPVFYRVAAVWGAHEGSLLLWIVILAVWTIAVARFSRSMPDDFAARVIGVLGLLSVGFILFTLFTSNPFLRLQPSAIDGADLNPLLQDPAMAVHPPMLYVGYVGFAVAFAFSIAAMLSGRLDRQWARWTRPWTTAAWVFLTLGIALGSYWAYYELGWGGWWFWDPVENASFMPWLVGTALFHSLAVTETRGLFKSWTLLLAISAFSLSLLGTFLVRSGILVSVHAFASDPTRGYFILAFLTIVIGSALALYAWRAPSLDSSAGFEATSRETFLLLNNVLLVVTAMLILLGTLYPLILDAMGLGKISVGPPFFDLAFIIPMLPLALLVGFGMHATWRHSTLGPMIRDYKWLLIASPIVGVLLPWLAYGRVSLLIWLGVTAAFWVMFSALAPLTGMLRSREFRGTAVIGMHVAHFGVGLFVLGATIASAFNTEADRSLKVGGTTEVAGYTFMLDSLSNVPGPNYSALRGHVLISRDGEQVADLYPEKRVYRVQRSPMTEAGIDGRISRDLFVALGDPLGDDAWSVRLQYKPLLRLVWLGTIFMAIGGLLALSDRRYRVRQTAAEGAARKAGGAPAATDPAAEGT
jgi:cytochrome c-type biogenesis protein CcmF